MKSNFDREKAKKNLLEKEKAEKEVLELKRQSLFEKAIALLQKEFQESEVEVFLVGSILHSGSFTSTSDIDIVVKNFDGDRFALWTRLEEALGSNVEVIRYEHCPFQEFVLEQGYKVL